MSNARTKFVEATTIFSIFLCCAQLTACGGGDTGGVEKTLTRGQIIDSPIAGLAYSAGTSTGVTDAGGYFLYEKEGESVTFYLGGTAIGTAPASAAVHIFDLNISAGSFGDVVSIRLAQLLQTLDTDQNASNGIHLSDAANATLRAQGVPDLTTSDVAWAGYMSAVANQLGRAVVSLAAARAHAIASIPDDAACSVRAEQFPLRDSYKLGTFSTAGRTCKQKAQAAAFYYDVIVSMGARENEVRASPSIASGEAQAKADVEALISQNLVANALDWVGGLVEFEQINNLTSNKDRVLRLVSASTGVLQKSADLMLAWECLGELPCKDQVQSSLRASSVLLGAMSRTTACFSSDWTKCAESLKSAAEVASYFKMTFGTISSERVSQYIDAFVAWTVPAIDSVTATMAGDRAKAFQAGGSFVDAAIKTYTGFYFRSASEVARRNAWANAFEIFGEAVKVGADCAVRASLENLKTCAGSVTGYTNRRASEISAYVTVAGLADDANFDADSLAVASAMISEIFRNGGLYASLGNYGVPIPTTDGISMNAALNSLARAVAVRAKITPISTMMGFFLDYTRAVEYYQLYWSAVESSANALLAGRAATCSSVELAPLIFELSAGGTLARTNESVKVSVPVVSTAPLQGFLVDLGDGTAVTTGNSSVSHQYVLPALYKVRATPIVKSPNGSLISCEARAATGVLRVTAAPSLTAFSVAPAQPRVGQPMTLTATGVNLVGSGYRFSNLPPCNTGGAITPDLVEDSRLEYTCTPTSTANMSFVGVIDRSGDPVPRIGQALQVFCADGSEPVAGVCAPLPQAPVVVPPVFSATVPARLEVTFSQPMNPTYFTTGNYIPSSSVWESSTKFVITFSSYTPGGTITLKSPTATDSRGFRSAAGVGLANDYVFQFPSSPPVPPTSISFTERPDTGSGWNLKVTLTSRNSAGTSGTFNFGNGACTGTLTYKGKDAGGNYMLQENHLTGGCHTSCDIVIASNANSYNEVCYGSPYNGNAVSPTNRLWIAPHPSPAEVEAVLSSQPPSVIGGLVGKWTFDDCSGADSSGQMRDASISYSACITGKSGKAVQFANPGFNTYGGSDAMMIPGHSAAALTFSAWVNWGGSVQSNDTQPFAGALWSIGTHGLGAFMSIWINEGSNIGDGGTIWTDRFSNSAHRLTPGVWTMISIASDGRSESLYLNGELINAANYSAPVSYLGLPSYVARSYWTQYSDPRPSTWSWASRFRGAVDDVRVYDRSLSASEIRDLYLSTK